MSTVLRPVRLIGAAIGEGAPDHRTRRAPASLRGWGLGRRLCARGRDVRWGPIVQSDRSLLTHDSMAVVAHFSHALSDAVCRAVQEGALPIVIGGDHSCAIGTWSGVHAALHARESAPRGDLGLIWIDAHLDAHTPETSRSGMPHGMPLAALLGRGQQALTDVGHPGAKVAPGNAVLIGPRSWESGERALLRDLGVRLMDGEEVLARGFAACLREALERVTARTSHWGISFDLDALDPVDVPGTGTPVERGIALADASAALHGVARDERFVACELVEYNPALDVDRVTAAAAECILGAMLDRRDPAEARPCRIERRAPSMAVRTDRG